MKEANFAPVYACLYPGLAEITRKHGWALAAHGSLINDFDLICIPWVEEPSDPKDVVEEITTIYAIRTIGDFFPKLHGRIAQIITLSFGECRLDLSFMPTQSSNEAIEEMVKRKVAEAEAEVLKRNAKRLEAVIGAIGDRNSSYSTLVKDWMWEVDRLREKSK